MKLLVQDSVPEAPGPIDGVEIIPFDADIPIPPEHTDADGLVVWGNPGLGLGHLAEQLTQVKWVQTLAAGPDSVLAAGFPAETVITSGRSLHDVTVAEHALALTLAAARHLNTLVRAQIGHRWAGEIGGGQPLGNEHGFATLREAHVVIWGFGSIGRTLARYLQVLGAQVTGIATSARVEDGVTVVDESGIADALAVADVLIMVLPSLPSTEKILDATTLAMLRPAAWLVNVGRGSTVDEDALVTALRAGSLAGAALDVTRQEPLPPASTLWDEPNVIITPHAAGGRPIGGAELIEFNAKALRDGTELRNVVER